jgi:peptide-methionine (R)-S-oxide reductase
MPLRQSALLSCLGILGMAVVLLMAVPPNLAADKTNKPDSKSSAKSKEKAESAKKDASESGSDDSADSDDETRKKVVKTDAEWRKQLTPMQFKVTRRKGTEIAGKGIYAYTKKDGIYRCVCCGQPLFDSKTKFDSGTGWPSFFRTISPGNIEERSDASHGMVRVEIRCRRCDGHLGHVFPDGPPPEGNRYCLNSASLQFFPDGQEPPQITASGK